MSRATAFKTKPLTYTVDEIAALLRCSRASAYRAINAGSIPSITIGRRVFVPRAALTRMLKNPTSRTEDSRVVV